ncbi:hypothetical protein KC343_g4142 [Hortaea werneckii]|nr:hypothetical protein KC338_g8545 [Hortaea werneckii]KAI6868540.1 hypothetical protein KC323_g3033 [Hortaea werneckii]KAI7192445.1 hypothetical protein KC352_g21361 [Hortaea werneckii]KAI7355745.1 hypothetical protein KC320_g2608 [Hortaea werneckii]KAI7568113.1 hypothetical protein KC317_g4483 [Hortaea werneckii]
MEITFPIMDLPAELRTIIYEFVVLGLPISLDTRPKSTRLSRAYPFTSPTALLLSSKAIHREFSDVLRKVATSAEFPTAEIQAHICDFDFDAIPAALEGLSPYQNGVAKARIKHVKLRFLKWRSKNDGRSLRSWCHKCAVKDKIVRYTMDGRDSRERKSRAEIDCRRFLAEYIRLQAILIGAWSGVRKRAMDERVKIYSAVVGPYNPSVRRNDGYLDDFLCRPRQYHLE